MWCHETVRKTSLLVDGKRSGSVNSIDRKRMMNKLPTIQEITEAAAEGREMEVRRKSVGCRKGRKVKAMQSEP